MSLIAYALFFASGFAALVYQIVWQRLLVIFSGSDVHSATLIVAAFMAGLGCGSLAGARLADRLPRAISLAGFALAELAIAVFGLFSATLYYDVLYHRLGQVALGNWPHAAILFISLLWPTFFMGVSLPLLARSLTTDIARAAHVVGGLYACNTAGAAVGAFAATWLLMPAYGIAGSLRVSAAVNVIAAAGVLPLVYAMRPAPATGTGSPTSDAGAAVESRDFTAPLTEWAAIYGLTGFISLSFEIVWFRLMGVILKSTAVTFGTLLSVYLTGLGLGAGVGTLLIRRIRRPARTFLFMQAAAGIYAGLAVTLVFAAVGRWPAAAWLREYFGRYESIDIRGAVGALRLFFHGSGPLPHEFLWLYIGLPALLIGPPTLLMGAAFPLLQKAVQTDLARIGQRIGVLLAANIAGSALGSMATGWVALAWLGTAGTLKLFVAVSAAFPLCALAVTRRPGRDAPLWTAAAVTFALGALLLAWMPGGQSLWARFHGSAPVYVIVGEDGSGTSVVRTTPGRETHVTVFVNGFGQSWIPYGGIHTILGALPAFIHPHPRSAALIGLGSGDTLFGVAGRPEIERVTCVEIVAPQIDTLRRLARGWPYPGLEAILRDPRIHFVEADGRLLLMQGAERYDIIEADALQPTSAFAGNLYSDAYFALMRDRLNPGGIAVSWSPTRRVHDTFVKVFPHVMSYGDILLGSNEPIAFDANRVRARVWSPPVVAYYERAGIDIRDLLARFLGQGWRTIGPADDRSALVDLNTDLFPKDEFAMTR